MKKVLIIRDFGGPTGGHLKVFHYLQYMHQSGLVRPQIYLTPTSVRDQSNFFLTYPELLVDQVGGHDLLFLGGVDWPTAEALDLLRCNVPIIGLIQNVCHAEPDDRYRPYNRYRATRICNGQEVANAIRSLGDPNGPMHVIPSAFALLTHLRVDVSRRRVDVFIAAFKDPALGEAIGARLVRAGITVDVLTTYTRSDIYHARMARARVAILLTYRQEGSPLPALAAMGLDVAVVCPDTPGIHDYCRDHETALLPDRSADALAGAAERLLTDSGLYALLRAAGRGVAERHTLERERSAFLPILSGLLGS
jgi:glycosyltransferase involved in cell wall biosynthesis